MGECSSPVTAVHASGASKWLIWPLIPASAILWAKQEKYDRQRRKVQEAEKQAKSYATLQAMAPTNIKTVHQTSLLHIENSLDRLRLLSPTHDQRSQQKGQSHPLPSFIRNTSLQRFPLVDVVPSWRLPYLVLTILVCLYRTNPHCSEIFDFLYFSAKPMTTLLVTNSQVLGVRLEYLDRSKSEGSSGSLRS